MYITQFEINTKNHLVFKDLTNLSAYHGMIESAFPAEQLLGIRKRHLWRLDKQKVLLVSEDQPDKDALAKYGKNIQTKNYDKFLDCLNTNTIYAFELVENPTKSINIEPMRKKRINLYDDAEILKHLQNIANKNGFRLKSAKIANSHVIRTYKHNLKLNQVRFVGTLVITNLKTFKNAMVNGLGHNKAYGMGLLTVIPLTREK